jgi:protein TonB
MLNKKNKVPSLDEIVFESRNKEYGACILRKKYVPTIAFAFAVAMIIGFLAILIPYLSYKKPRDILLGGGGGGYRSVNLDMEELPPPPPEQIYVREILPPREKPATIEETVIYAPPEVVDSLPPVFHEMATAYEAFMINTDTLMEMYDDVYYSDGYDFGLGFGEGSGSGAPFMLVETMPSFRGGDINSFRQWVQQRTIYPQEAVDKKIQGRVLITFIIEADGTVSNVTVVKSVDPSIDNEAVRVISSSPKWRPGLQGGNPVRVRYSMWLGFVL